MQMIAYLFELGYDLALSRSHNVSQSPGFEVCRLIFNKKYFDCRSGYFASKAREHALSLEMISLLRRSRNRKLLKVCVKRRPRRRSS